LVVLGLLASRTVTLDKAAEVLGMSRTEFSAVLKTIGFKYSYLDKEEIKKEIAASKVFLEKKRCS